MSLFNLFLVVALVLCLIDLFPVVPSKIPLVTIALILVILAFLLKV